MVRVAASLLSDFFASTAPMVNAGANTNIADTAIIAVKITFVCEFINFYRTFYYLTSIYKLYFEFNFRNNLGYFQD